MFSFDIRSLPIGCEVQVLCWLIMAKAMPRQGTPLELEAFTFLA